MELVNGDRSQLATDIRVVRSFAASIVESRQRGSAAAHTANQSQPQQPSPKGPAASTTAVSGAAGEGAAKVDGEGGSSGTGAADLLSMFLAAETEDGLPLGKEQLVDMVLNFIIAGRDTTAQVRKGCHAVQGWDGMLSAPVVTRRLSNFQLPACLEGSSNSGQLQLYTNIGRSTCNLHQSYFVQCVSLNHTDVCLWLFVPLARRCPGPST
jgi:hypothetical protein